MNVSRYLLGFPHHYINYTRTLSVIKILLHSYKDVLNLLTKTSVLAIKYTAEVNQCNSDYLIPAYWQTHNDYNF